MITRRKVKKKPLIILGSILILLILIILGIKTLIYHTTYEYKLIQIGYNKKEATTIQEKLNKENINSILQIKYNKKLVSLLKGKYFIEDNLKVYLDYYKKNSKHSTTDIIAIVNVNQNNSHYTHTTKADTKKNYSILVNKYNYLDSTFAPDDITNVSLQYSYEGNSIRKKVYEKFKEMWNAAKKENFTLIINSSYRSYERQNKLYKYYKERDGQEQADAVAARPGYSEHQTGLALDITTYNANSDNFEETDEYKWLQKNAHKYGFILRYPKDKTYITGYDYESWHYRYVGVETATKIYKLGITFDEYYAYYLK